MKKTYVLIGKYSIIHCLMTSIWLWTLFSNDWSHLGSLFNHDNLLSIKHTIFE